MLDKWDTVAVDAHTDVEEMKRVRNGLETVVSVVMHSDGAHISFLHRRHVGHISLRCGGPIWASTLFNFNTHHP